MKKKLLLFVFLGIAAIQAQSQVSLSFANMTFGPGAIVAKGADTTGFVSPTPGASQTWNYASLTNTGTYNFGYINPASVSFPTATHADTNLSAAFVPGYYYHYDAYYKHDATANAFLGIDIPLQNYSITAITGTAGDSCYILPQHVIYTNPVGLLVYPTTMNSAWHATYTDVLNFQLTIANYMLNHAPCQKVTHYSRLDTIVGWGTATVPATGGPSVPYNCLLEKRTTVAVDSFFMNGIAAPAPMLAAFGLSQGQQTISNRSFLWRENSNYPLMLISYGSNNFTHATSVTYDGSAATAGIQNIPGNENVSVFPNPASDHIFIQGAQHAAVSICDITGRIVYRNDTFNPNEAIDISGFGKGNFIVRITSGSNTTVKKLVVL